MRTCEIAKEIWRRRPDLNRGWRFCRPLPYHLATAPLDRWKDVRISTSPVIISRRPGVVVRAPRGGAGGAGRGPPRLIMERETGFEPATSTLARSHSTTELFPLEPSTVPHGCAAFKQRTRAQSFPHTTEHAGFRA